MVIRDRAMEMLREGETRLIKAFRSSPVAMTIGRIRDQKIVEVNDAFTSLVGWTRGEAVERSMIAVSYTHLGEHRHAGRRHRARS